MSIEKVVNLTFNTQQAQANLDALGKTIQEQQDILIEFEQELVDLEKQLKETGDASFNLARGDLKKRINELKSAIADQRVSIKSLNNERKKAIALEKESIIATNRRNIVVKQLDKLTGGLATQFVDLAKTAKAAGLATRSAFIATGIGAIVAAVATIVLHWKEIKEFITQSNALITAQNTLLKAQMDTNEAQLKTLHTKRDLLVLEGKDTTTINKLIQDKLALLREQNKTSIKNLETQLAEAKAVEVQASWWERILNFRSPVGLAIANEKARLAHEAEIKSLEKELELLKAKDAQLELTQFKEANPKTPSGKPVTQDKEQDILDELEAEALAGLEANERAFQRERDRLQGIKDIQDEFRELSNIEKIEADRDQALAELDALFATEEEKASVRLHFANLIADEQAKIDEQAAKEEADRAEALKNLKIGLAYQTLDIIGSLAKEGSVLAKGVAVAQATIDTYRGAVAAYAAGSAVGGPAGLVMGPLAAGLAVAAGLANIHKILSTKEIETSAPAGGRGGSGGGRQIPQFNLVEGTASNQLQETIEGQTNEPQQAIVVSGDVTNAQEADRNAVNSSTL